MRYLIKQLLPAIALVASLTACTALPGIGHTMSWKEEVKLHDGQVIIADRFYNLGGYPAFDSHNRSLVDETLTFSVPGSSKEIVWKTEFRNDLPEPSSLGALLLDVVGSTPYLATSPAGCIAYNQWGRPNPPYVLFKYVNQAWQRISLEEFPPELVDSNLMSRPDSGMLKPYYSQEQVKEQMQGRNIAPEARTILRKTLPQVRINEICEERVQYKGYWILPNDPVARKIIDQRQK